MEQDVFIPDEHLEDFSTEDARALRDHIRTDSPVDLTATDEGRDLLRRFKASRDAADPRPPRVPEMGELPPMHLQGVELERWIERQRRQSLLPDDPGYGE